MDFVEGAESSTAGLVLGPSAGTAVPWSCQVTAELHPFPRDAKR